MRFISLCWLCVWVPVVLAQEKQVPSGLRTYRFSAKITENGGVTPFEVDKEIRGRFTYDLEDKSKNPPNKLSEAYCSERNTVTCQIDKLTFTGTGDRNMSLGTLLLVSATGTAERFGVVARDFKLPVGWDMNHSSKALLIGVGFQNQPARNVLPTSAIPDKLQLADWKDMRGVFVVFDDVKFPGGEVKGQASVKATIEKLEEVSTDKQ
jgi:hypothetical protein